MTTDFPNESHDELTAGAAPSTPGPMRRFALPAVVVAGAMTAGSFLAPLGLASAQEDDSDTDAAESDETGDDADNDSEPEAGDSESDSRSDDDGKSHRHYRGNRGLSGLRALGDTVTETLGVTADDLKQAMQDGKSLADVADEQGVAVDDLTAALTAAANEQLDAAVADGKIDDERAAQMSEALSERIDNLVNATADDMREGLRQGFRKAHRAAHQSMDRRSERAEQMAEFLGLTSDELRESLADGSTLAELALAQGVSEDDLVAFIVDGIEERVDAAVADGKIDADKAAEKLADVEEKVADMINAEPGERRGNRGHHKNGSDRSGDKAAETESQEGA